MNQTATLVSVAIALLGVIGGMLTWFQSSLRNEARALQSDLAAKLIGEISKVRQDLSGEISKVGGDVRALTERVDGLGQRVGALEEDFRRAFKLVPAGLPEEGQ